jgi:hypothetical protein
VRRARPLRAHAWGLLLALLLHGAGAQPFAADGGFGRPERLFPDENRPLVALALDQGRATVVRRTEDGWARYPFDGDAERTVIGPLGIRELRAAGSDRSPLQVLWTVRDPTTGNYLHHVDADLVVQTSNLPPLLWLANDREGILLSLRVRAGVSEIVRVERDGPMVLHRSELQLKGLSGVWQGGDLHLTWLEGFDEVSPFGLQSAWIAYAGSTAEEGGAGLAPVALGRAAGGLEQTVTAADAEVVLRAFVAEDGRVARVLTPSSDPGAFTLEATLVGRPIGGSVDGTEVALFIARGESIFRWRGDAESVAVAWSPVVVLDAWSVRDRAGVTHLLWIGTDVGGNGLVYRSDDRAPMARTWSDRLAARFGWRPWSWREEATGQALTALLMAVLVATGGLPWLLPVGLLVARRGGARARLWGAGIGAGLPTLALFLALLSGASARTLLPLFGGPAALVGGAAAALLIAMGLWLRRDIEALPAFVLTAATALAIATGIHVFLGFQAWLALGWW